MAGPLEHAGVEDVLSSIRRLVSEDSRTQNANAAHSATAAPAASEPPRPRLVLTPALRVLGEAGEEPQEDTSAEVSDTDKAPLPLGEPKDAAATADQIISHLSAAVEAEDGDEDASAAPATPHAVSFLNGARSLDQAATHDVFHLHARTTPEAETPVEEPAIETSEPVDAAAVEASDLVEDHDQLNPPWKDPGTTLYHAARALEGGAQAEETGSQTCSVAADTVAAARQMPAAAPQATDESDGAEGAAEKVTEFHNASARHRAAAVVRKIAEMEATGDASTSEEHWEPDAETCAPFAEEVKPMAAAPVMAAPEVTSSAPEQEPVAGAEGLTQAVIDHTAAELGAEISDTAFDNLSQQDDGAVLDEDALREMVVEIVRQELQGALGEKITRNVRKLVRREIHQALAAQNLV